MSSRPRRSIVTRLAATFATSTTVLLMVLIAATHLLAGRQLSAQLDDRLEEQALALVADVDAEDADDPVGLAEDLWGEGGPPPFDAQLLRRNRSVAASTGAVPGGGPLIDSDTVASILDGRVGRGTIEVGGQLLRLHARPVPDTDLVLVAASDLDPVTGPRQALLGVLIPVGTSGVLALAILAWLATRRALRPLEQMAERAETIGVNDLSVRLASTPSDDELDRLASTINRMLDRLADLIDRERQFTADASHELRTPLAIVRAELELAEPTADKRTRLRLASAQEEIDRLAGLIDDLLVLARADADRLDSHDLIDLTSLVVTVRDRFAPLATRHNVELTATATGTTHGDLRGLDRALSNLTHNALRHTPAGGRVRLRADTSQDGAHLIVTDTGPGVPEHKLPTLFDRFTRTDDARTAGGAGLGLAIVAAVATAHHGSAIARNLPDGGLEIHITLAPTPTTGDHRLAP